MIGSLKKLHQMTIWNHMSHCKTLNGYIPLLPTLRDSVSAVASSKNGNIAFNDATSTGIILATCPTAWQNQYNMNHRTIPESPRAMLQDLENIDKVFANKYNEKARANKAKASKAPKTGRDVPGKRRNGGGSNGPAPKKGHPTKYC